MVLVATYGGNDSEMMFMKGHFGVLGVYTAKSLVFYYILLVKGL